MITKNKDLKGIKKNKYIQQNFLKNCVQHQLWKIVFRLKGGFPKKHSDSCTSPTGDSQLSTEKYCVLLENLRKQSKA